MGCVSKIVVRSCVTSLFLNVRSAFGCSPNISGLSTAGKPLMKAWNSSLSEPWGML